MTTHSFSSDYHLGVLRTSNTSMKSRRLFQDLIFSRAMELVQREQELGHVHHNVGDLFDKHSNEERVVLQGTQVARCLSDILEGNHDRLNIVDSTSSLDVVADAVPGVVVSNPEPGTPYYRHEVNVADQLCLTWVPHCFTQALFEQSIEEACCDIEEVAGTCHRIILLHCNVGENFGHTEKEGSTLSLTDELQSLLLLKFDHILVGHEHEYKELHGGRLRCLGNLYPLSFGEVSDRFIVRFDTETRTMTRERIFKAQGLVLEMDANELLGLEDFGVAEQWVDLKGSLQPQDMAQFSRNLQRLWKDNDHLVMVRKGVEVASPEKAKKNDAYVPRTLVDRVNEDASNTEYAEEFALVRREIE